MIWTRALSMTVQLSHLRQEVRQLRAALLRSRAETAQAREALRLRTRDVQFLTAYVHSEDAVEVLAELRRFDTVTGVDDLLGEAS